MGNAPGPFPARESSAMSRFWSPFVETLAPYTPGEQPRGRRFIKLNTNENPYGPSPAALEAMRAEIGDTMRLYPDPMATDLRAAIADAHDLDPGQVFVGNGSDEVLGHAFNAFFRDKGPVRFPDVTYSFYPTWCGLHGIPFATVALDEAFRWRADAFDGPCGGIVLANPNAPTGIAAPLSAVEAVLSAHPDTVVIVDEAYVDFGGESAVGLVPRYDNLLVVQTFSKSRSLAGLRVGFALGQPELIEALVRVKDSFNSYPLGRAALAGAQAAFEDRAWFEETCGRVIVDRDQIAETLQGLGFTVLPSCANFIFASHATVPAEEILSGLRERGILVRHFPQERTRNWLRVSIGTATECDALAEALSSVVATG